VNRSIFTLLAIALFMMSANYNHQFNFSHDYDSHEAHWVDSVFDNMTLDERLGQLFMLRAHSDKDAAYEQSVADLINQYHPGGLCFFQGTPEKQAELTNYYQSLSDRLPLMISMDAEWGLGMRLKENAISFPKQLMLGAMQDNQPIYEMGLEMARQCRRLGVHVSFSPACDVNNNSSNPVINERSFGEDRYNVAAKSFQYMRGLQDGGVLASAKHFPGHGDTNVDSHLDLPIITHSMEHLDSLELFPFRVLIQHGVASAMVSHLSVPAMDSRKNYPASLSEKVIFDLLRTKMGFEGLIFTDGMEMKGVTKYFSKGEADLEALRAGNDIVLLPESVAAGMAAVKKALNDKTLNQNRIFDSVKRVLRAKYRLGITKPQRVKVENIRKELNTNDAINLKRKLIAKSLTLVRDENALVPFKNIEQNTYATLAMGATTTTTFQKSLANYAPMTHFNMGKILNPSEETFLIDSLKKSQVIFVSLHNMRSKAADNFGLTDAQVNFIRRLCDVSKVVLTVFGNPYSLRYFDAVPTLFDAYNEDENTQDLAAQALFGAIDITGSLPVTASARAKFGDGVQVVNAEHRLGYALPEQLGISSDSLAKMDDIVREMIGIGATPGCQILIAKDNQIIWNKSYGYYTYEQSKSVTNESLYDLASVTKVGATTLSIMHLYDEGKISLGANMSHYVPELKGTNKENITVEEMLTHHSGLIPWIAFYKNTVDKANFPLSKCYKNAANETCCIPVADNLFMEKTYLDSIWTQIFQSELRPNKNYKYSDLNLFLTARAFYNITGNTLDNYTKETFYRSLGMSTMTFNPWKFGLKERCVPTEEDRYFRQQRIQGYVHDMGAGMLGGESGHAGLFSNANDLAKIFQMLLNKGSYFGKSYIRPETVRYFTTRYSKSTRRGIGFDMKELNNSETKNMSELAGENTFGHMGFTGICAWADPDQNLIFILCSNRTYPSMDNNKFITGDYRPRLQSVVYRALRPKI
jgi:beta-N-acetylhexosaminidase